MKRIRHSGAGNSKPANGNSKSTNGHGRVNWAEMRQQIDAVARSLAGSGETSPEVLHQVWARRAAQLAQVTSAEDAGEHVALVLVQLGREVFGLEAQYIFDIRPLGRITRVPRLPDWVAGVVNLRGRILSAVDLQRFFGLAHVEPADRSGVPYLVHVETPDMELALRVDEVLTVEALPVSQIHEAGGAVRGIRPDFVRGVAQRNDRGDNGLMVILDLPAVLADKQLIIHEEVV